MERIVDHTTVICSITVGKRGTAVLDVRDDAEVADQRGVVVVWPG
ncbi:hypothetical protein [Nonomuraea dietziae]